VGKSVKKKLRTCAPSSSFRIFPWLSTIRHFHETGIYPGTIFHKIQCGKVQNWALQLDQNHQSLEAIFRQNAVQKIQKSILKFDQKSQPLEELFFTKSRAKKFKIGRSNSTKIVDLQGHFF